jgi:hypothetical protein
MRWLLESADGYHASIFLLFRERKLIHLFEIRPEDHAQRYVLMRTVAHEVTKHAADAVIALGEVWIAPYDPLKPYQRAAESAAREEALTATLVSKHGIPIQLTAKIRRDDGKLALAESSIKRDPALFSFAPTYEVWGRPIPDQWLKTMKRQAPNNDTSSTSRK